MKPYQTPLASHSSNTHSPNTHTPTADSPDTAPPESLAKSPDIPATDHEHGEALHDHVHSEESLRKLVNRLSRLEGHIRGIKTMVQENRPCPDVLVQVAAVRGGLDKVARLILDEHLNECITRAVDEGNIAAEVDALKAALDRFIT